MKTAAIFLALALLGFCASGLQAQRPAPGALAITHVTVIDGTGKPAKAEQTVVLAEGRIVAVGPSAELKAPAGARVVDGSGKFLIPGLWDMHVHIAGISADPAWSKKVLLPLLIANGITGARDMGGDLSALQAWRQEIDSGALLGPHLVTGGPMLVRGGKKSADQYPVASADEARAAVRELKQQGADFIKIISLPSREAFFAVAEEAKRQGLPFVGHVPAVVTASEASDAGMKSIEHIVYSGLAFDCSSREEELRKAAREASAKGDQKASAQIFLDAIASYSPKKAAALWARFKRNGTWVVPTLYSISRIAPRALSAEQQARDPELEFVPEKLRKEWNPLTPENQSSQEERDWWARQFANDLKLTAEMHRAGVHMLAGSDSLDRFVFPGSSLQGELELLQEAGFSPMEALQSATRDAAQFLGGEGEIGVIQPGLRADLVLLDANPLQTIANVRKINAVIRAGNYLDRAALDRLLLQAKAAAKSASVKE